MVSGVDKAVETAVAVDDFGRTTGRKGGLRCWESSCLGAAAELDTRNQLGSAAERARAAVDAEVAAAAVGVAAVDFVAAAGDAESWGRWRETCVVVNL